MGTIPSHGRLFHTLKKHRWVRMAYFEVVYFDSNPIIGKEKSNSPLFLCLLMFQIHIFLEFFFFFFGLKTLVSIYSVQFSSVAQLCPTLCDPMNRSTPGLPVHHKLPEFTQTHVHGVGDAIQPSRPPLSPSPPAPNPSQHQGLFQ